MKNRWKRKKIFVGTGLVLQSVALLLMATDNTPSGFGIQTLWIAPIFFLVGLILPILGLVHFPSLNGFIVRLKHLKQMGAMMSFMMALITYGITLEPTASLWDCGETIAAAFKLQVPHTPGIPLTLLLGRLFSMFSFGDTSLVAWWISFMSAFFSALTVSFTFLIIWYFGSKIKKESWGLFAGSMGGALCLMCTDTFWFSAVEAETYGPSSFFMVLLIYLSIQGQQLAGEERTNRWLLLAYLSGLSYCIHPMCILVLPVCFLIMWGLRFTNAWKHLGVSLAAGVFAILLINKLIAVDLFEWAFTFDRFLVNQWAFPFYSGVVVLLILIAGFLVVLWFKLPVSRVFVTAFLFLLLGFTPYMMLFIRSAKLPPINEFSPRNLAMIKPYMNRESYPGRPLLYGPYFDAKISRVSKKTNSYIVNDGRYQKVGDLPQYHYDDHRMTILPRIYSDDPAHIKTYQEWTGLLPGETPTFSDNLEFMFRYQLGHMYLRYLMWNFAGRKSDIQHADWQRPWDGFPNRSDISYSRANNQYFLLPFLLGLIGAVWQRRENKEGFLVNLSFFLITGILLALYLNATPNEPRERDYIYVGSYMAFSVWIGLGIMACSGLFRTIKLILPFVLAIGIPAWMFYQNLDDHNRSGRKFQVDHARNLLGSCEPNAILFTGGDNDTFPLWYLQEVEGFRTDVRVKVLSYFNADWYINQLTRTYYDSPPFQLTLSGEGDQYGPYNPLYIRETIDTSISWSKYMKALVAQTPQLRLKTSTGGEAYFLPSRDIRLSTSEGELEVRVQGAYLPKNEMAILDLIQSNDWSRSVYFNFTSLNSLSIQLRPYLKQQGLVYKLVPERSTDGGLSFDTIQSYVNLVTKADYANLANPKVYFNHEDYQSRMILPLKFAFNALIEKLLTEGKETQAMEVAFFAYDNLYFEHLEPSYADLQLAELLHKWEEEQAGYLVRRLFEFLYRRVENFPQSGDTIPRNDWVLLQESARFLNDRESVERYEALRKMIGKEQ